MSGLASELRHKVIIQTKGIEKLYSYAGQEDELAGDETILAGEESQVFNYADERDENGFYVDRAMEWHSYRTLWAKVTPVAARDLAIGQSELTEITARMKIRYRTDINTSMRVIWKGKIYSIQSEGLDDNVDGYTYTTFNLSSGVENG